MGYMVFSILCVPPSQASPTYVTRAPHVIHSVMPSIPSKHCTRILTLGAHAIKVEVASTPAQREKGLMFRKSLPPNTGMLFVFDTHALHCFWMKNTNIALSIAFIDRHGVITDIDDMYAQTTQRHCASQLVRYALEMPLGWFSEHGIAPGSKVKELIDSAQ